MAADGEGKHGATAHVHTHELCDACRAEAEERRLTDERAKRFAALVESSRDFLAMASLTGEILFVNKAGRELIGIQDFDGLPLERFHTEEGMKRAAIIREKGWWEGEGEPPAFPDRRADSHADHLLPPQGPGRHSRGLRHRAA